MTVKEFLRDTYKDERYIFRPHVVCADGYKVSIQAGNGLYSCPRENVLEYTAVELGFPNIADELIMEYIECPDDEPTKTVYPYVPVDIVQQLMDKHGGIVKILKAGESED